MKKINEINIKSNTTIFAAAAAFIAAEIFTILSRSENKNAFVVGLSPLRIAIILGIAGYFAIAVFLLKKIKTEGKYTFPAQLLGTISSVSMFCVFLIRMIDVEKTIYTVIVSRALPALIFIFITGILLLYEAGKVVKEKYTENIRTETLAVIACLIIGLFFYHYDSLSYERNFKGVIPVWLFPAAAVTIHAVVIIRKAQLEKIKTAVRCLVLFAFAFAVARTTQMAMGRTITPASAYWGQLAQSFIQGKLYIEDPVGFHDLTFYNDKWYVPNPPLPAILLIPVALILGPEAEINTTIYTAVLCAVNFVLVYLMLKSAVKRKLFYLNENAILLLTIAFIFGSDHLWLSTTGQMWFISQLVVVTFTILAVISQLRGGSPFLTGAFIAAAVMSRPNVFPVFFCVLGIYWQMEEIKINKSNLKKAFFWCLKCGIPVLISAALLLSYNKMRFDEWFDFGYVTINGAREIVEAAREYGIFNIHFIPDNAKVMFTLLPRIDTTGTRFWFYPYVAGYSMFVMSPQLFYVFSSIKKEPWIIGSWAAVLSTILMLLMYHNTGADQIGYRYILDAAAPLLLLVGCGMKKKTDPIFTIMTLFSVAQQYIGIYWWYIGRT